MLTDDMHDSTQDGPEAKARLDAFHKAATPLVDRWANNPPKFTEFLDAALPPGESSTVVEIIPDPEDRETPRRFDRIWAYAQHMGLDPTTVAEESVPEDFQPAAPISRPKKTVHWLGRGRGIAADRLREEMDAALTNPDVDTIAIDSVADVEAAVRENVTLVNRLGERVKSTAEVIRDYDDHMAQMFASNVRPEYYKAECHAPDPAEVRRAKLAQTGLDTKARNQAKRKRLKSLKARSKLQHYKVAEAHKARLMSNIDAQDRIEARDFIPMRIPADYTDESFQSDLIIAKRVYDNMPKHSLGVSWIRASRAYETVLRLSKAVTIAARSINTPQFRRDLEVIRQTSGVGRRKARRLKRRIEQFQSTVD